MSDLPSGDDSSRARGFNGIVVALLVVVGVVGVWFMFTSLYPSAPPALGRGESAREGAGAPAAPVSTMPLIQDSMSRTGATRHAIQLSPYSEVATAEDVRAKLDKLGIPSSLRIEAHVLVGPFNTPQEAEAARAKLKELGVYGGQAITLKP